MKKRVVYELTEEEFDALREFVRAFGAESQSSLTTETGFNAVYSAWSRAKDALVAGGREGLIQAPAMCLHRITNRAITP